MSDQCPVCKFGQARKAAHPGGDRRVIDCPRCGGIFEIGGSYCCTLERQIEPNHLLSGALRHMSERGQSRPEPIDGEVQRLLEQVPESAEGRAKALLEFIARRAPHPGDDVAVLTHVIDYPLAYAKGVDGLRACLDHLKDRQWIEIRSADESETRCTLTISGANEVE